MQRRLAIEQKRPTISYLGKFELERKLDRQKNAWGVRVCKVKGMVMDEGEMSKMLALLGKVVVDERAEEGRRRNSIKTTTKGQWYTCMEPTCKD